MKIEKFEVGPVVANCYVIYDKSECIVIDPGAESKIIIKFLKDNNLTVRFIVNTHGHPDHVGANAELKKAFGNAAVCIHKDDAGMLADKQLALTFLFGTKYGSGPADIILEEGQRLCVEGVSLEVIHTPGHTPGGISLLGDGFIFTGDTLFYDSIGRSDLPGGDEGVLIDTIKKKLFTLDEKLKVYPGHGQSTTIGKERNKE